MNSESAVDESRTEIDSHANINVIGRNALILTDTGKTVKMSPFTPEYEALQNLLIVDVTVAYDFPHIERTLTLVIQNALVVPFMDQNLVPSFIMREDRVKVNNDPKMQVDNPTIGYHSLYFPGAVFRIPLSTWGVFSYFPTRLPIKLELEECNVLALTTEGP